MHRKVNPNTSHSFSWKPAERSPSVGPTSCAFLGPSCDLLSGAACTSGLVSQHMYVFLLLRPTVQLMWATVLNDSPGREIEAGQIRQMTDYCPQHLPCSYLQQHQASWLIHTDQCVWGLYKLTNDWLEFHHFIFQLINLQRCGALYRCTDAPICLSKKAALPSLSLSPCVSLSFSAGFLKWTPHIVCQPPPPPHPTSVGLQHFYIALERYIYTNKSNLIFSWVLCIFHSQSWNNPVFLTPRFLRNLPAQTQRHNLFPALLHCSINYNLIFFYACFMSRCRCGNISRCHLDRIISFFPLYGIYYCNRR